MGNMADSGNPLRHPELTIAHQLARQWNTPALQNIITDIGSTFLSHQGGTCMDFEMRAMECIEYYGSKQALRIKAMFRKRHFENHLEYLQGKRSWDETYEAPPKSHAFKEPWFNEKYSHINEKEI